MSFLAVRTTRIRWLRRQIVRCHPPTDWASAGRSSYRLSVSDSADLDRAIDELVADRCGTDRDAFDDATRFDGEVLAADSLDVVELAEAVDAEFGVHIPDGDLEDLATVGDLKAYVADAR